MVHDFRAGAALRAGAISYLLKSVKMDEVTEAVRRAARGEATLDPPVAARVVQELQVTTPRSVPCSVHSWAMPRARRSNS